jgi:zinc transport system substrate-binding protein
VRRWLPPLVLLSVFAAGCGEQAASDDGAAAVSEESEGGGLTVVAAAYPFAWLAGRIAPDAEVNLLNEGAQEAHDLDITPTQRAAIETADVVLFTGDIDYQPQVEQAVPAAQGQVVSAAAVAGESALLAAAEDEHEDEGEAHSEEEGEAHSGEVGGVDPHLWFDPSIMADVAVAAGEAFAAADPDNAETYEQNAEAVREQMETLGADLEATLGQDCSFDEAIVSHAAYGYLLTPFGKEQHSVSNVGAEGDASAGALAEIVTEIREEGFTHVLAEPVEGRAGAEAVVAETGVQMLEIVPLDAVTDEQADTGLPDLIRAQAAFFATALGCA